VPRGGLASSPAEVRQLIEELGGRAYLKAQVLGSGRAKAGGVRRADSPELGEELARSMLGSTVLGQRVDRLLVVETVDIASELYVGFIANPEELTVSLLASPHGGVDVEELSRGELLRIEIDPLMGLADFMKREVAKFLRLPRRAREQLRDLLETLYDIYWSYDCEFLEVNPLALTTDNRLVAIDVRMSVDDSSLFRHPELREAYLKRLSEREAAAREHGFSYVELDGNVGVIGNGAGLTMATMDMISDMGLRPAFFLDVGGGASSSRVREALRIALSHPRVRAVLMNILGGITRCDEVAKGIVEALSAAPRRVPLVVRLSGTNEEEGRRILEAHGIRYFTRMEEAVSALAEILR